MARRGAPRDPAERTRRRFARRQWARRWLAWRYVVAVVVLVALVTGGIWAVYFSSWLSVSGVEVDGVDQLSAAEVREAAAVPEGEALARVDLDRIRSRVEALAPVRSADVSRQWPDQVLIEVEERVAVAVVEIGGQLKGMDDQGVVFRDYAQPPAGLPRVETGGPTSSDALREAALVAGSLPTDLQAKVDHVEVATIDEISLELRDGRSVEWGSADDSELKARVLADLLAAAPKAPHYDVSVPGRPTTHG
ncbi:cell division protein FtsQ/DivIB [Nocardioides sp. T2.26MG-1]|uniref:cell division protein FtsQ/DivIB n=1 Tax=Nocardioides sp. T2.26MG-1 TaxID=3041166 RepID=UPI002477913C|nr:FtsQ-type POTRA domain-containing protein [Nocardioides sp. T2.26MG-1]CAI9419774.1 Cell division protein FtsQ [Nocardioides sp. T2.26MG-1]